MNQPMPIFEPPPAREKTIEGRPTFFRALRGVWLFTWKSQLTWRKLLPGLFSLLGVPVLIYITTFSTETWARRFHWVGNPVVQLDSFPQRLGRSGVELRPDQGTALLRIFAEEYGQAEADWSQKQTDETGASRQRLVIRAAHEKIRARARSLLDGNQIGPFLSFEKMQMDRSLNRVRDPRWGRVDPFYRWLIDFYFFMILPLGCVRACGALVRDELQADTLGFLTTRPLSRARLLVIKYITQTFWLQIIVLIETLLVFAAGNLRDVPGLGPLLLIFLGAQFLAVAAWSALGTFFGLVTKRYMPMAIVYGLIVEMGIGRIPTNINTLSLMRHLKSILANNPALQHVYEWTLGGAAFSAGALVLATGIFLTLAALLFTFKEYHHTVEMQN